MLHTPFAGRLSRAVNPRAGAALFWLGRFSTFVLPIVLLLFGLAFWQYRAAYAAVSDIEVTIYAAPNLVVDSNVLSPSTQAPEVATVIGRFCNTSGTTQSNIVAYIGDYNGGAPSSSTPGVYPSKTNVTIGGQFYSGTYRFTHLGGTADATRIIGDIPAGECRYQYWSFSYPKTANGGTVPTWGTDVQPNDDLSLDFDVWAAQGSTICNAAPCSKTHTATMRNEISAMANKIEPNGNPGGSWFNTNADTVNVGDTITTNGILYRLGNINQGFDNNGDLVPDYNAWLQPIGNPTYDPSCFRLIEVSGVLTVTRSSGNPDLIIPFNHSLNQANDAPLLYFTDLPTDNTDVNGLVFYTFMALGGPCTVPISPYQEVASGSDNEKFNGDYGAGGPGKISSYAPNLTLDKSGPTIAAEATPFQYAISFQNTGSTAMGLSLSTGFAAAFVISDTVPNGLQYIAGSAAASNTAPPSNSYVIYYSTNSGLTWSTTDPGTVTSSGPNNLVMIQWWLNSPLAAGQSGTVRYQAQFPAGYGAGSGDRFVDNCADARLGTGSPLARDCATTGIAGLNTLGDRVWADDGAGGGVTNNGAQDGSETSIANITVNLYWDRDNDGVLDPTDPLVSTQTTSAANPNYDFTSLPDANYMVAVDTADPQLPIGYGPTTPRQYAVNLIDAGNIDYNDADFGFGPSLVINKNLISNNPAYEGDTVTFQIELINQLPGDGTSAGNCRYTIWASIAHQTSGGGIIPPGGGPTNEQWQNTNRILGIPDFSYATTEMNNNDDTLGISGFNSGNQGGTITDVDLVLYMTEVIELDADDQLEAQVYYNNATLGTAFIYNNTGPFAANVGDQVVISQDIDNTLRTGLWTWTDFAGNLTELQLVGNRGGGVSGDLGLDAAAYVVTTNQVCGGSDTTITTLPLTDTYDADLLQFVSATPTHSTNNTSGTPPATVGTTTWANLGPLYAGQTKSITVTFTARDPGASAITTTNTALVNSAYFGNGRPVNDDTDTADVQIIPTGSISGRVWSEGTGGTTGWVSTTGYEAGIDTFIPGVTVTLFGCYTADPASGGTLITDVFNGGRTCAAQAGSSNWFAVPGGTTTTDANGTYSFTGLSMGYYYVAVSGLPGGATQSAEPIYNGTGLTCGTANATCNATWNPTGAAVTVLSANLDNTNFNPIGTGDPLGTPNEDIINVNFGYQNVPARIFGTVYSDENADGNQDSGEEPLSGVTVRLCADTACTTVIATTSTAADGSYSFTGFTTPGNYYVAITQPANTLQSDDPDNTGNCGGSCDNRTDVIAITAGQISGSHDFGYHPFTAGQDIGDTVYVDWNGDGDQDSGEEGIANVTVYLYEDEDNDGVIDSGVDALIETDATDASGNYLFPDLPNGNYIVVVNTADPDFPGFGGSYTQTDDPDAACPGALCESTATSAAIAGGDDLDNDFGYQPSGFGSIGDYVWTDSDADATQDGTESGINGVSVNLYQDQDGDGLIDAEDALVATTTTAAGGLYLFEDLAPGNYIVSILLSEFGSGQELNGTTMTTGGAAYTNTNSQVSYEVALDEGEDFADADFGFATGKIGDFIWRDDNGNGTPDPGEPGISGVTVSLYRDVNGNGIQDGGDILLDSEVTNATGIYSFTGLISDTYVVVVTPPAGYTLTGDPDAYSTGPGFPAYPPCSTTGDYDFCDHQYGVSLYAGEVDLTADFGYQPFGVIGDRLWLDSNGDGDDDGGTEPGIAFITVTLYMDTNNSNTFDGGDTFVSAMQTDSNGYYSFGGLTDNEYIVVVNTADPDFPAGLTQTFDPDETNPCATCDSVGAATISGGNIDLTVDFGYRFTGTNTISGTIWHDDDSGGQTGGTGDIDGGETIRYASVTVYLWRCVGACDSGGDEILVGTTTTNGSGQYSFTGLADGTYAVSYNPSSPGLAGLTTTTTTAYDGNPGTAPSVTFAGGGGSAIRDFGVRSSLDFGDLPSTYNRTILGDDGARHSIPGSGAVYLGALQDSDPDGQESLAATGDDTDGIDDEDGVLRNGSWANGANGGTVEVTAVCPTGTCYLSAWVDWNNDGDFLDSGERILLDEPIINGTQTVTFDVPAGTFPGTGSNLTFNTRFRLYRSSTGGAAQPTGYAVNGEVEDYQWTFAPTAVTLRHAITTLAQPALLIAITVILLGLLTTLLTLRRRP